MSEPKPETAGEHDPLAELVRVMSGELAAEATPAADGKTAPVTGAVSSDVPSGNDIEVKLLNDLNAISSAFYSGPPVPSPGPAPGAAPTPVESSPVPAPARLEAQPAVAAGPTEVEPPQPPPWPPLAKKPTLRPRASVPLRLNKRASAASLSRVQRQAPPPNPIDLASVVRPPAKTSGKVTSEESNFTKTLGKPTSPSAAGSLTATPPPSLDRANRAAASPAAASDAPGKVTSEESEFAKALRRAAAVPDTVAPTPNRDRADRAVASPAAASDPNRFRPSADRPPSFRPKTVEPPPDQPPKAVSAVTAGGSAPRVEEAVHLKRPDPLAVYAEDDGELEPLRDQFEEFRQHHPRQLGLLAGAALLAVLLAAGVTYVTVRGTKPAVVASIVPADPARSKLVAVTSPAGTDQGKKLDQDGGDRVPSGEPAKRATPLNAKAAEVPASSADDGGPISRVIETSPAKPPATPASVDHGATDATAGSGDRGLAPSKGPVAVDGPDMPATGSAAVSDDAPEKPSLGASPVVPPNAATAATAADAGSAGAPSPSSSGNTQMDAVLNGKGSPIPIDADPLAIYRTGDRSAADAPPSAPTARVRSPEPVGVSAADASSAGAASGGGTATADQSSAVPGAPARVPTPPPKPVLPPEKAHKPLAAAPPVASSSSGDVY